MLVAFGTTVVLPSVMVTDRSAFGVSVSVSLVVTDVPPGGVTVATLVNEPVTLGLIVVVNVKVTLAPAGRSTVVARAPAPLLGPVTLLPPVVVDVQVALLAPAGSASKTLTPLTAMRLVLLTTMM